MPAIHVKNKGLIRDIPRDHAKHLHSESSELNEKQKERLEKDLSAGRVTRPKR